MPHTGIFKVEMVNCFFIILILNLNLILNKLEN